MATALATRRDSQHSCAQLDYVDAVKTSLGYIGWRWSRTSAKSDWRLAETCIGERSRDAALRRVQGANTGVQYDHDDAPDFPCDMAERFNAWADGADESFADVPITLGDASSFRKAVTTACRRVRCGEMITYGELARQAGHAGAARAVGRVMATNPLPVIVPCHRVVASGGKMRGFSAAGGVATKQRMLKLEGALA